MTHASPVPPEQIVADLRAWAQQMDRVRTPAKNRDQADRLATSLRRAASLIERQGDELRDARHGES